MNLLIQHIEYLISRNDCVIIPRLGALLSQYCPARIDAESGVVYPPRRKFTFNSAIRDNDATLALSISKATGISCQRAIDYVNKETDSMLHQLHSFGYLSLGRVGTLNYNIADGTCEFEPFEIDRLSVAISWLPAISADTLTNGQTGDLSRPSSSRLRRPVWTKVTRIAAVVAVLLGVWFVASTPVSVDNKSVLTASLAPDISGAKTPAILSAAQKAVDKETLRQETFSEPSAPQITSVATGTEISDMAHGQFYIIVGATVSAGEAQKFIELHPDIKDEAFIVRYGKKHVICVSAHDTPEDANTACVDRRKTYPDAWIGTN